MEASVSEYSTSRKQGMASFYSYFLTRSTISGMCYMEVKVWSNIGHSGLMENNHFLSISLFILRASNPDLAQKSELFNHRIGYYY